MHNFFVLFNRCNILHMRCIAVIFVSNYKMGSKYKVNVDNLFSNNLKYNFLFR